MKTKKEIKEFFAVCLILLEIILLVPIALSL
jgi:hypothetical protein